MLSSLWLGALLLGPALEPVGEEARYLSNITQVTNEEMGFKKAGEAYFSPDGQKIIFQAVPAGQEEYQIYTLDLLEAGTPVPRMVSTGKGACTCAYFHPSGKKIIFASSHLDPTLGQPKQKPKKKGYQWDFNEHMDIFEADVDGSNLRRLTDAKGYDAEGSYSPDGKRITFTSQRDDDLEIYIMNSDGTMPKRLTKAKGYDGGPFFWPDNATVVYRGDRRDDNKENLQLRLVTDDGFQDVAITDNEFFNWCPFPYPSGTCLIFTQADHEAHSKGGKINYDLFLLTRGGSHRTRVTHDPEFDGLPAFSRDGRKLMWTSKRGNLSEAQVFIADFKIPDEFVKNRQGTMGP